MTELADTSAWSWSRQRAYPELRHAFDEALVDGRLATCDMVRLELLHSARSATEVAAIRQALAALPECPIEKEQWNRALWVYEQLSAQGGASQRSVKHPDLLIAAAAEAADVSVLHYDEDFDRIAAVTGQPTRWQAPKAPCADHDQDPQPPLAQRHENQPSQGDPAGSRNRRGTRLGRDPWSPRL